MKRRLVFFLITALIAVLVVMLINSALKTKQATIDALQHGQSAIVVAARSLPAGSVVDGASLKLATWPRDSLPPGSFTDSSLVEGRVLKQGVVDNQPIVAPMLLERGKSGGLLPFLIPDGMRAMSIPVTPVSDMAGMILPHTRVDVLVTSSETGGAAERTCVVLQNIQVVAVQTMLESSGNAPQRAEVVTLLVTPVEAERLAAATHLGTLQLAMRSYEDQQTIWTRGIDSRELLGLPASLPAPQQLPAVVRPRSTVRPKPAVSVEVIRNGKERQTINFARTRSLAANPEMTAIVDQPAVDSGSAPAN
jgi:pilus assembly protein CpaB